jgi:hypothetical protein
MAYNFLYVWRETERERERERRRNSKRVNDWKNHGRRQKEAFDNGKIIFFWKKSSLAGGHYSTPVCVQDRLQMKTLDWQETVA